MKSYTDLEQSKMLAEILSIESSDCYWDYDEMQGFHRISWFEDGFNKESQLRLNENNVCAWSLAALVSVLRSPDLIQNSEGTWLIRVWGEEFPWSVGGFDNPIDVCYEMILRLHGLNLL